MHVGINPYHDGVICTDVAEPCQGSCSATCNVAALHSAVELVVTSVQVLTWVQVLAASQRWLLTATGCSALLVHVVHVHEGVGVVTCLLSKCAVCDNVGGPPSLPGCNRCHVAWRARCHHTANGNWRPTGDYHNRVVTPPMSPIKTLQRT